ncbi:sigma-54-dependent Fis family transcriptional regulator [Aquisalimonas asiatica]|uniref:Nif-specific regulatory protein n=1 Tax=Aquisalimonas asiatica TaxID=406100 RepID=A0A1H8Q072_9GAMM|nr:sigma 54-interacting transcriptional regulator [Aquisalimonas asiatica]SEO47466.1 Nif-specific regulatory protein [Aquisalimonas asiatica]
MTTDSELPGESLVLLETAQLLGRSLQPEATVPAVLRLLSELVGLNRGRVVLPDDDGQHLRIRYSYGLRPHERDRGVYRLGEGITGDVMRTGRVCVVQDVDAEPQHLFRAVDRATLPDETVSFIAVPILVDAMPIGVLGCHRLRARSRGFQADIQLLRIVAAMLGQTLRIRSLMDQRTAWLEDQNEALREALARQQQYQGILGDSPQLRSVLDEAGRVADNDVTVMLLGESGTGKERFARYIHEQGPRAPGPFICINCSAIPATLLEAEIFGHERGAFTGAVRNRPGKAELADGGTLFLDEIGDMDVDLQAKLLRLIQERKVQRVGGDRDISVDIRIITATHRNLQEAVNLGQFRLDLFYRLNVVPIRLPPLRERTGDVVQLARHFLDDFNARHHRDVTLGPGVLARLQSYPWPGNIRQLENLMERAVITARGTTITAAEIEHILNDESAVSGPVHVPPDAATARQQNVGGDAEPADSAVFGRPYQRVDPAEADQLRSALARSRGNKTRAAQMLGLSVRQFRYRLTKLGLD